MKSFAKTCIFSALNTFAPKLENRASILMYHSVSEERGYFSAILPEIFTKQMAYLAATKREIISLTELVRRLGAHEPLDGAVVLTFDDGYRDNYTTVFPLLKQYGFPATIFVTTDIIDTPGYCSTEELREMQASNLISIEPHTRTHPKLAKLSRADAEREIHESREKLRDILGAVPSLFAYPYGSFSSETIGVVRGLNFAGAVTVEEGTVGPATDLLRLPRNSIDSSTTFSQFRGKVSRAIDWYVAFKTRMHI